MKISFIEELEKLKRPIWRSVQKYLIEKEPLDHYKAVNEYPKRQGKYLRPALVQLSAIMYGAEKKDAILTATAMQISEDWLLVHDDFLDHSDERRSTSESFKPSLNKMYGDEIAVNAGDALHTLMWKVLGDNVRKLGYDKGWKIYEKMNDIILTTLEGQYAELDWIRENRFLIEEDDYFSMVSKKTCNYTITGPLQLGAILANKNKAELDNIGKWGLYFGYAFQIHDDVMNLTVDHDIQGKEKAGDIQEGKRTLIFIHLLKNCSTIEKKNIKIIYKKEREKKSSKEVDYVLNLMEKYNSIIYAKKIAENYSNKALEIFEKLTASLPDTKARKIIREGITFVVNRNR